MLVFALGLNHRTAAVDLRETLASSEVGAQIEGLRARWHAAHPGFESVCLSTCNRFELYLACADAEPWHPAEGTVEFVAAAGLGSQAAEGLYLYEGEEAARHLFRVTASLDSLVLGEDQIQAQVKQAYAAAVDAGQTGPALNHLFHRALATGKRIRHETAIAKSPVSVASAGVALARQVFGDLADCRVLVLGAGEMARLTLRHLADRGARSFAIANRTRARAVGLAEELGGRALALAEVPAAIAETDLVVSATASRVPVLTEADVRAGIEGRVDPLLLVDLGLPRNLDPAIHDLDGALLYDLDDLEQVTDQSRLERRKAARRGEEIAAEAARGFLDWLASRKAVPLIQELLRTSREVALRELDRALKGQDGLEPAVREACTRAVEAAVKKVLHRPLVSLRGVGADAKGRRTIEVVRGLFDLEEAAG